MVICLKAHNPYSLKPMDFYESIEDQGLDKGPYVLCPMSYVLCPADHYMIESYKFWRCDALTSCGSELIIEDFNA